MPLFQDCETMCLYSRKQRLCFLPDTRRQSSFCTAVLEVSKKGTEELHSDLGTSLRACSIRAGSDTV